MRYVKVISHGAKILNLRRPPNNHNWFYGPLRATGLHDLVYTGYTTVPQALLMNLCERWHTETIILHMPLGEMILSLDDVACLCIFQLKGKC